MTNIVETDAILARDQDGNLREYYWPEVDVIVGNPPFLGGKRLRAELKDAYVDDLFALYRDRVPREANLVTCWFERAWKELEEGRTKDAGLLATNSIRGGANRRVLSRIRERGGIFFAESDLPWILNGADVRVSMIGFDNGAETHKTLGGVPAATINPDLTGALDLTEAQLLHGDLSIQTSS